MNERNPLPLLTVRGLTQRFGGIVANDDIDFDVARHSITALIGPNGAGKTTTFNCITGFYRATRGTITLHPGQGRSHEIGDLLTRPFTGGSHQITRAGIARTFQNIRLFHNMTVMENLLVAQHRRLDGNLWRGMWVSRSFREKEREGIARAMQWLARLEMSAHADRLAGELPYGLQRLLEIARAMCTDPLLICLDEPAAGLNPAETEQLAKIIQMLRGDFGVTVLLIEHDMDLVMEISDHIIVLNHGQVIAQGTPDEVRNHPEVITAYLGTSIEEAL